MAKRRYRRRKTRRRQRGGRKSRRKSGGSIMSALKTALLPFLFYKVQKRQQKRVGSKKRKTRKR